MKKQQMHVDSERDEPAKPFVYYEEILDIEDEVEASNLLAAKQSCLKQALSGKSQFIIKKRLVYADMAWGTDFQIQPLQHPTGSPHRKKIFLSNW